MKKSRQVWIVDDDNSILEVVQVVLNHAGYNTQVIAEADCVFEKLHNEPHPDVILLDILMSGIDGREISQKIKQNPETKHIPIIILSADTRLEEKTQEAGADDFLRKPFNIEELVNIIEKYKNL